MRLVRFLLTASLLVMGSMAAKKSSGDRFNDFHSKALSNSPIKLKDKSYNTLTAAPRDFSVVVLLTALDSRVGCQMCREFQPEWELLAKSWIKGDKGAQSRTLFGTLDFADGREVFLSLGLQTAPVLMLFPPTTGDHAVAGGEPIRYDFSTGPPTAELIHSWVSRHLPDRPHPPVRRPINWMRWISTVVIVLGTITVVATASPYVLPILQNRNIWASVSLISILLFTSGHMFNHIRKVPYVTGDGKGGVTYFAGGFQTQYGLETQIVAALYGVLAFCAITLAIKVPRIAEPRSQSVVVFASGAVLFLMYSFLLSVFRVKNGGYPFSLPPFM